MNNDQSQTPNFVHRDGRISEQKLSAFLNHNNKRKRTKSVSSPTAHTNKQCDVPNEIEQGYDELVKRIEVMKEENKVVSVVAELMSIGSLRVSEVLRIDYNDLTRTGQLLIRGSKGSSDKLINVGSCREYLNKCRLNQYKPFAGIDRFYVYRQFKKYGIEFQFEGKSKRSVTHVFRQINNRILQKEGIDESLRRSNLGHKGKTAIKYYNENKA